MGIFPSVTAGNESKDVVFLATVYLYEMYVYPVSCFLCVSFALSFQILPIAEAFVSYY